MQKRIRSLIGLPDVGFDFEDPERARIYTWYPHAITGDAITEGMSVSGLFAASGQILSEEKILISR